jgi:hypothetical protein
MASTSLSLPLSDAPEHIRPVLQESPLGVARRLAGARATHGELRLDRHWRNLRTHTLHDPLAYKIREIGEWALKRTYPTPSFYS